MREFQPRRLKAATQVLTAVLCVTLLSGCVSTAVPTSVRPPVGMAKDAEATQTSLKAQGLTHEALRKRWGIMLDLLDARFIHQGDSAQWYAFEWIDPGTVVRWWVRGCGNFGCGEPYQITVTYVPGEDRLRVVDTVSSRRTYIRVKGDGTLEQENSCCKEAIWSVDATGDLLLNGRYRRVNADQLAAATAETSRSVSLAADTTTNAPPRQALASTAPSVPAVTPTKRAEAVSTATPQAGKTTLKTLTVDPVAQALKAKFPTLTQGITNASLAGASKPAPKAAIYLVEIPRASRARFEVRSAAFEPMVAVYEASTSAQLASAADSSVATLAAELAGGSQYLVVVQSANGKLGDFAIEFIAR